MLNAGDFLNLVSQKGIHGSYGSEYEEASRDLPNLDSCLKKCPVAGKTWAGCQPLPVAVSQTVVAVVLELPPMGYINKAVMQRASWNHSVQHALSALGWLMRPCCQSWDGGI